MQQICKVVCCLHPFACIRHFKTKPVAQYFAGRRNVPNTSVRYTKHDCNPVAMSVVSHGQTQSLRCSLHYAFIWNKEAQTHPACGSPGQPALNNLEGSYRCMAMIYHAWLTSLPPLAMSVELRRRCCESFKLPRPSHRPLPWPMAYHPQNLKMLQPKILRFVTQQSIDVVLPLHKLLAQWT